MKKGYTISLLANAALFAALIAQWRTAYTPVANPPAAKAVTSVLLRQGTPHQPRAPDVDPVRIGGDWRNWIEPLRTARVPTEVLAGLVQADFDRRWQSRQTVLQEKYMRGEIDADGLAAAGIEHEANLDLELQAALGTEPYRAWDMHRLLGNLNVDRAQLSDGERNNVYELERGLRQVLQQAQSDKLNGTIDQATLNAREQSAQESVTQKLRVLLGEQRASGLQGADDTLGRLKRTLNDLPLDQTQLYALVDAQQQWDRARSDLVTLQVNTQDPTINEAIRVNDELWQKEFEQMAGRDAFDRYVASQDSRYVDLQRHAKQWGVAPGNVDRVFANIQNFDDTIREFRSDAADRNVDSSAMDVALQRFTQETEQNMKTQLGDAVYRQLESNGIKPVLTP